MPWVGINPPPDERVGAGFGHGVGHARGDGRPRAAQDRRCDLPREVVTPAGPRGLAGLSSIVVRRPRSTGRRRGGEEVEAGEGEGAEGNVRSNGNFSTRAAMRRCPRRRGADRH